MRVTAKSVAFAVLVAVVAAFAFVNAASTGRASTVRNKLTVIAPASPGGGWDGFAREVQQTTRTEGIVNNVQVVNVPGAGGTIGLSQFVQMRGRSDVLMVTGGVMVGAIAVGETPETLADVTPIARIADDYSALVVPADSDIMTLADLVERWRANPGGVSIAGGSLGGIDHLTVGLLAREIGINPKDANYIAYSGGGEALSAMLSHTTTGGISGYKELSGQIEAGALRLLAISAPERMPGIDAPTFIESGINVSMANWRGLVAPPGLTPEQVADLTAIVDEMHASEGWRGVLQRNAWSDTYLPGAAFGDYMAQQQQQITRIVKELDL